MITISLCMIVRNEEDVLGRCLDSVDGIADEIIIVDTGSTDGTKEVAKRYTALVFEEPWRDNFAAVRNTSFSKATMDYCMWLDADDVITEENRERLKKLKADMDSSADVVMMKYLTAFDAQDRPVFSYYRERLIKNHRGFVWEGRVHEAITPSGRILYLDIAVEHRKTRPSDADRNLRIYERMIEEGEKLEPRQQFYYGRELYYHSRYGDAAKVLEDFLSNRDGWVENKIEACMNLCQCKKQTGKREEALNALWKSFRYDRPRAEICCEAGLFFAEEENWRQASFWYELALKAERRDESGGFILDDCHGFLPHIQLCVCYDKMGDRKMAYSHHLECKKLKPEHRAVLYNDMYFSTQSK